MVVGHRILPYPIVIREARIPLTCLARRQAGPRFRGGDDEIRVRNAAATTLAASVRAALAEAADPARAPGMQAYMKSAMPYLGVSAVPLRQVCKALFKDLAWSDSEAWQARRPGALARRRVPRGALRGDRADRRQGGTAVPRRSPRCRCTRR